jgi:hypothetical protein
MEAGWLGKLGRASGRWWDCSSLWGCRGFIDPPTPNAGDHITVTGPYVIDTNVLHRVLYQARAAENWAEIHPAWAIRVDQPAQPGQPNQFGPEFGEEG